MFLETLSHGKSTREINNSKSKKNLAEISMLKFVVFHLANFSIVIRHSLI